MADNKERGLYEKYKVERTDGKSIGQCFVLELDDPNSWDALIIWSNTLRHDGYEELAWDVIQLVAREQAKRYK